MPPRRKARTSLTYAQAGVSLARGQAIVKAIAPLARTTARAGASAQLGGFAGVFDLAKLKLRNPLLLACTDGVGSKLKLAIASKQHDTIGQDLVAMCVNDLIAQGATPLFFLDYLAMARLDIKTAKAILRGISKACRLTDCALLGGETAEMPGLYRPGEYDLAGFAVGAVARHKLLPRADICAGDAIIGLASDGIHANGYSLVHKILARGRFRLDAPAPFQKRQKLANALLTPTRLYTKALELAQTTQSIKAMAHITGGGLEENVPRVLPPDCRAHIHLDSWVRPQVFHWLAKAGHIRDAEMLRVFNCGIGMVLIASANRAKALCTVLQKQGERACIIGTLVSGKPAVTYQGTMF